MRRSLFPIIAMLCLLGAPVFGGNCTKFCAEIKECATRASHAHLGELLCRTARCETGDKCIEQIDSPNGKYSGPFQFAAVTWKFRCRPFFRRERLTECLGKDDVYDTCCSALCAAEMISRGGLHHWRHCGRRARAQILRK